MKAQRPLRAECTSNIADNAVKVFPSRRFGCGQTPVLLSRRLNARIMLRHLSEVPADVRISLFREEEQARAM